MVNNKNINRVCIIIGIVTVIIAVVFSYFGESLGITATTADLSYVTTLFDDSTVHAIDIEISEDDWNTLQETATDEEYQRCAVTIDGEKISNVAIRPKGNSSLSSVASTESERYSFKIDFDEYSDGLSYNGLDKLNLNNVISDNTYLKDYLSYNMMAYMGVDAPLTSFVRVSVNGEYFGLYLAVEDVEEAFAQRNYGTDTGNIYKPDSMNLNDENGMGGGNGEMPDMSNRPDMLPTTDTNQATDTTPKIDATSQTQELPNMDQMPDMGNMPGGNSGNDVALIYSDDELSSYDNIWSNAVFDVTNADKETLIDSIKKLNAGENLEDVVDVEEVLKYFVVHSFVDNFDSYTGSMKHNYYLREEDGQISVIAWDYNLAFSAFSGGGMGGRTTTTAVSSTDEATTLVNYPIDTPVSGTTMEERPLLNELLENDEYLALYHQYYQEFITGYFDSGEYEAVIDNAVSLISTYVEDDPTAFCTYDEYENGVAVLKQFCDLRAESISGQLAGTIPATTTGQSEQPDTLIDASTIDIAAMGSNLMGKDMNTENTAGTAITETAENSEKINNAMAGQRPTNLPNDKAAVTGGETATETKDATAVTNETSAMPDNKNGMVNPNGNAAATNFDISSLILIGISFLVLGGGILATKIYKR
ncbi:CotH kinase family protein [Acetobacterium bakii]|uniref:Spore coat protein CotH n=1 Tax=Acetobacterium bakii TaxID=52689 RepID=A0A0L6U4T1_9FIRM|nr:CotH kinase family protein [Acetobacterium bakii]KNZ43513.1 hypothetical protein AKG39_01020 [Acetobacterium bakii]